MAWNSLSVRGYSSYAASAYCPMAVPQCSSFFCAIPCCSLVHACAAPYGFKGSVRITYLLPLQWQHSWGYLKGHYAFDLAWSWLHILMKQVCSVYCNFGFCPVWLHPYGAFTWDGNVANFLQHFHKWIRRSKSCGFWCRFVAVDN